MLDLVVSHNPATLELQGADALDEVEWFECIQPDFRRGNANILAGAAKLIKAKESLKGTKGSFHRLVEKLGLDLGKAERLMKIARHPVLSDSAHAPNLPLSWMTQYTLSALPPEVLEDFLADGTVHPGLERKAAEQLVRKVRDLNLNGCGGRDCGSDFAGTDFDEHGGVEQSASDSDSSATQAASDGSATQAAAQDVGPDSPGELAQKLARLEELERETRRQEIRLQGCESELEELRAKLGPEMPIRAQRRLFQRAMHSLQKSDMPGLHEKESRSLKQDAATDLIELVRSAVRDGLQPDRFDLTYRPESSR
jgi:hypothetical protein